jgi:competence protein ComEA
MSNSIDLNTATEQQLASIHGINRDQAKTIVDYRNQNGIFNSWEDLKRIPGIQGNMLDVFKRQGCTVGGRAA